MNNFFKIYILLFCVTSFSQNIQNMDYVVTIPEIEVTVKTKPVESKRVIRSVEVSSDKAPIINDFKYLLVSNFDTEERLFFNFWWEDDELLNLFYSKSKNRYLSFITSDSGGPNYLSESNLNKVDNALKNIKTITVQSEMINGNYVLFDENTVRIFQMENTSKATRTFYALWNSLLLEEFFKDEILEVYIAEDYTNIVTGEGEYRDAYKDLFGLNIIQMIVEGEDFFYIFKIDTTTDSPFFYYEKEPIVRIEKYGWYSTWFWNFKVEYLYLKDGNKSYRTENMYIDSEYDNISNNIFEWEAKDIVQRYTVFKIEGLNNILDEYKP